MKIIAFGDIHLSKANLDASQDSLAWLLNHIRSRAGEETLAVCLGDLVCSRTEADHRVLGALVGFFAEIEDLVEVYCLVGNHDIQYNPEAGRYFASIVHVVAPATVVAAPLALGRRSEIGLTPYFKDQIPVPSENCKILFCHGDVADHPYGETAIGPPIAAIGGERSKITHVFCGHQHLPKIYEKNVSGRSVYFEFVGCLAPRSFADAGALPFGLIEIDLDEHANVLKIQRIVNPFAIPYLKSTWREGQACPDLADRAYHLVDVSGSEDFCGEAAEKLAASPRVTVRITEMEPKVARAGASARRGGQDYLDGLLDRWAQAHGGDPAVGKEIFRG